MCIAPSMNSIKKMEEAVAGATAPKVEKGLAKVNPNAPIVTGDTTAKAAAVVKAVIQQKASPFFTP